MIRRFEDVAGCIKEQVELAGFRIVCLHPQDASPDNLVAFDASGDEAWRASASQVTRSLDDFWTGVGVWAGRLVAFTWSCFRVELDARTGKALNLTFTK
jgi:hypothetical protein